MSDKEITEINKWNSVRENWDFAIKSGGTVDNAEAALIVEAAEGLGGVSFWEAEQALDITEEERLIWEVDRNDSTQLDNYYQAAKVAVELTNYHSIFPGTIYPLVLCVVILSTPGVRLNRPVAQSRFYFRRLPVC